MGFGHSILMRAFGRPRGFLGRLGGSIMARSNDTCAARVIGLLEIKPNDAVLEIGFGPGVGIQRAAALAEHVAGIDYSREMVRQATARNAAAIKRGRVDLRYGSVEALPFADQTFDKAFAINSMQVWPDAVAGLREIRRVTKAGGRVALGFTPHSGQPKAGSTEALAAAGFADGRLAEMDVGFCALATRP